MGKNKGQKSKIKKEKAFTVLKPKKSKTKAVTTTLKKMNFQTKAKTVNADEKFKAIQDAVFDGAKSNTDRTAHKTKFQTDSKTQEMTVDMETTTETFAKL